ncbi:MAG: methylenetetrahydrofolate reductase [NAD(P)H] [Pseudomonadaceae bacterium]|nr:methylenetetrahydrofolate reductase [NAD(P)H] [Pseudomonadaceae bacterium]
MRLSFEFFPPRTKKGEASLLASANALKAEGPEFFSVTYGAGGSTRDGTRETVSKLLTDVGVPAAPHLSIGNDNEEQIRTMLDDYKARGVNRIVALRGDVPSGAVAAPRHSSNAESLVKLIRAHSGDAFHIEVAAYPEVHPDAASAEADLDFFARKVDAGADSAITQYFFNPPAYFDFIERAAARGIGIPIVPGIMPITNFEGLVRFSKNCGADIPRWLGKRLESLKDDPEGLLAFGNDVTSKVCEALVQGGAPGIHFYTLNKTGPALEVWHRLRTTCAPQA